MSTRRLTPLTGHISLIPPVRTVAPTSAPSRVARRADRQLERTFDRPTARTFDRPTARPFSRPVATRGEPSRIQKAQATLRDGRTPSQARGAVTNTSPERPVLKIDQLRLDLNALRDGALYRIDALKSEVVRLTAEIIDLRQRLGVAPPKDPTDPVLWELQYDAPAPEPTPASAPAVQTLPIDPARDVIGDEPA